MYRKHNHRVGATRAAWLSLPALFVRGWDWVAGISTSPKPLIVESHIVNDELPGNPGGRLSLKSCLTPFVVSHLFRVLRNGVWLSEIFTPDYPGSCAGRTSPCFD